MVDNISAIFQSVPMPERTEKLCIIERPELLTTYLGRRRGGSVVGASDLGPEGRQLDGRFDLGRLYFTLPRDMGLLARISIWADFTLYLTLGYRIYACITCTRV